MSSGSRVPDQFNPYQAISCSGLMNCAHCREEIDYGKDVLSVEEGVAGPRGFVPLEEKLFFCSEECLRDYYDKVDLSKLPKVKRRVP